MATQNLYRTTLVCSVISFIFMFVAFASPFWYQSWRRVHSPFGNIGLWHVCLQGYIIPHDPIMKSYVGCWWIHSSEFDIIKDDLQPVWFRFVQAFSVFSLLMDLLAVILVLIFFPKWRSQNLLKHRIRIFFISSALLLGSAFLVFLISLVFAEMTNDSSWMPRPWMNYLSWSYGLCVVSGFFAAFGGMSVFVLALVYKDKELHGDPELTSAAEIAAKRLELEKQDAMMRQQGGVMMKPSGQRTPHGSGQVYPRAGHYQQQPAYRDRPDHYRLGSTADPPPRYGSQQRLPPPGPPSVSGSHTSRAGSHTGKAAESFV